MREATPVPNGVGQGAPVILLAGANGQLGQELLRSLQGEGHIVALDRHGLDLADFDQIRQVVRTLRPAVIVNAAAYTAVDRAEADSVLAQRINAQAPGVLAEEAARLRATLIHYSTDYVFDGTLARPYVETDAASPLNVYGRTKLAGEAAIAQVGGRHLIFRTSWVYGLRGANFLLTMLRLAQTRDEIRVVSDQCGAPTWTRTIAAATAHIVAQWPREAEALEAWWARYSGLYHLTAAGSTSWHGFASAIFSYLPAAKRPNVMPIATTEYPTPATRPANSCLSTEKIRQAFGFFAPDWEDALRCVMDEYADYGVRFGAAREDMR
ncbi:dTDP-4-dehydrorhamnose reductase [Paraburkholderia silviterrae]|uniref:dTDP-4-dehydrorhamnose reductase n=1 Tax=Paraburkholderia silviterrae TaxID=2528715 RepID=A0A4R5LYK3_9BURK|nr:dTDP-4-dehydrorhamnose reductase [Paraburkholderia silviterrae]TDG17429.1 dTDP-4-dehydrorhamnose reductase [Paraburkholderia silviterrae]